MHKRLMLHAFFILFFVGSMQAANAVAAGKNPIAKDKYIIVFKQNAFAANSASNTGESTKQIAERMIVNARQQQRFHDNAKGIIRAQADENRLNKLGFVYGHALKGFSATLTEPAVQALSKNPMIGYIEPDYVVSHTAIQMPTPSWGLDRIDQRDLPLDNSYEYHEDGANVHVYVLDTGIRADHSEFTGRVGNGYDFIDNDADADDCHGHGSHVAGTVAGMSVGVAKNSTIYPVKVLDCQGDGLSSQVIAGVDWISANHQLPAIVNMSLSGDAYLPLDTAINNSINLGITYVVAAGNDNADACNSTPARVTSAITVASSDSFDRRSSFSNIGPCVDLFAPGSSIVSAGIASTSQLVYMSGTSMAAPHVAGVAALYLEKKPNATPYMVANAILANSSLSKITDPGAGTPNRLLFSQISNITPPPPTNDLAWMIPVIHLLLL